MDVAACRNWGRAALSEFFSKQPLFSISLEVIALETDILLAHVLGVSQVELITGGARQLSGSESQQFRSFIERRKNFEPIAYLVGAKEFYGRDFLVTPDVLIPRPETELLVECCLFFLRNQGKEFEIIDVGTGSGVVILSIFLELSEGIRERGAFSGIDISEKALFIAKENAERFKCSSEITFFQQDLLASHTFQKEKLRILVSNPPYVVTDEPLPPDVENFEPRGALRAGPQGMDIIERLLREAKQKLSSGDKIFMEIGDRQQIPVESLALELGVGEITLHKDLSGKSRVFEGEIL